MKKIMMLFVFLITLLLAILACQADNMRARDLPVWTCPTSQPPPTWTMAPGLLNQTPAVPTYTPYPTGTPYQAFSDFPLEKHVKIGGVGGVGLGIWVWMEEVQVDGPFPDINGDDVGWVASWTVTVENASATQDYEFYPFAQLYVIEVIDADGLTAHPGAWGISGEAHDLIGLPQLELTEATTLLHPGDQTSVRVAAIIPGSEVWRLGYVLDPLDTEDIDEMQAKGSIGSNVGAWVNAYDTSCVGEITPEVTGTTQPLPPGLLFRHPVDTVSISRGFGCSPDFTGELGTACPAGEPWFHNGVDYSLPQGSPYIDPVNGDGSVVYAGDNPAGPDCSSMAGSQPPHEGYGLYIKHEAQVKGHGLEIWGAHLSGFTVSTGDPTSGGNTLGGVGSTGCSSGSHLHFSVRVDGLYADPLMLIP